MVVLGVAFGRDSRAALEGCSRDSERPVSTRKRSFSLCLY